MQSVVAGGERNLFDWTFTFPWDADVRVTDQILYQGLVIELVKTNAPGTWITALRMDGNEVQ
jgi:hypothetical protein